MIITLNIPDKRIHDLLHGHGGQYSPWLQELTGDVIADGFFQAVYDLETEGVGHRNFNRDDVMKGLSLMAIESPTQFGQFLEGDDDDITFDVALQFVIFGKVVFS